MTTIVVPIRSFMGMQRLAPVLPDHQRTRLAQRLAEVVIGAGRRAGFAVVIVTADPTVSTWGHERGCTVVHDPGLGLDEAARAGIHEVTDDPWLVAHADLPLATAPALIEVAVAAASGVALVPSADGGTSVIAASGDSFEFSFGPSSFHRHLARNPGAVVIPSAELSIDIDTPDHLKAFPWLGIDV